MEVKVEQGVYYKHLMEEYKILSKTKPAPKEYMTKQWVDIMVQRILAAEAIIAEEGYESLHESVKTTLGSYTIERNRDTVALLAKRLPGEENSKTVVALQESYDVIQQAHHATDHGQPKDMEAWLVRNNIMVHNMCSGIYRKLCKKCCATFYDTHCNQNVDELNKAVQMIPGFNEPNENQQQNASPVPTEDLTEDVNDTEEDVFTNVFREEDFFLHVCSVDILDLTNNPDQLYKYLLIHQDRKTKFIQLRPMTTANETEISVELIKILMDFSTPECIVVDAENKKIFHEICEKIKILTGSDIALALHKSENKLIKFVAQNIVKWMQDQDCKNWGTGCYIVQWNMNNESDSDGDTPFSKIFGYKYTGCGYKSKFNPDKDSNFDDVDFMIELNPGHDVNEVTGSIETGEKYRDQESSELKTVGVTMTADFAAELESLASSSVLQTLP